MNYSFSLSGIQHKEIKNHLFPGDGLESAGLIFCHLAKSKQLTKFVAFEIIFIANEDCERTVTNVTWNFRKYFSPKKIEEIDKNHLSIITIHSHPNGFNDFSNLDDNNDLKIFSCINNWFNDYRPNGSAVMLPNGFIFCRAVNNKGGFEPFLKVNIAGSSIKIFRKKTKEKQTPAFSKRIVQTFGQGTFSFLRQLKIGVVGCSGTGSIVTELLARNGIGEIVLVDNDKVEKKNLNRILNASLQDAEENKFKVEVLQNAVKKMGLGTKISTYQKTTSDKEVLSILKECDILFGCVDSAIGRYHLDYLSAAYLIPYFDVGVTIFSDNKGNISEALAVSHYIEPGVSSLLERKAYNSNQVYAESLKIQNPKNYEKQKKKGYITGIEEDQPAVMSLNMQASCLVFNDFMARIHIYRLDDNSHFCIQKMSLTHGYYKAEKTTNKVHPLFSKELGKADQSNLIKTI